MQLLLDTHVALWAITDAPQLTPHARSLISSSDNKIFVSDVSIWEICIKHALQRSNMPISGKQAHAYFQQSGYFILGITTTHILMLDELPNLHRDPFDRLLVAQARAEPLRLVTHDTTVARYSDSIIYI
ncbi:type II toxin-antitoxin system VapC family toxin [Alkanindiges sp. WGS2144]|uniref:type II toxin-antitoxin system VapC family toxin n=1 Tax=Alkanindiges sp. WGS2144 TaxID=3366808 RepID=UPI003751E7A6